MSRLPHDIFFFSASSAVEAFSRQSIGKRVFCRPLDKLAHLGSIFISRPVESTVPHHTADTALEQHDTFWVHTHRGLGSCDHVEVLC